jgi:hypothetical protein
MNRQGRFRRLGEITIDSDRITTLGMALLFVIVGAMLIGKIRVLAFGVVTEHVSLLSIVTVVYCFLFAFSFPGKFVKAAFILLGTETACRLALKYLHASTSMRHAADVAASVVDQVALTIILFAIVQWFKSVIHWAPPSTARDPGL